VAVSYLLTLATLVAVFGRLADLYGRKMLYTFGFLVFIAGSAVQQARVRPHRQHRHDGGT
jgi:MFS family permease